MKNNPNTEKTAKDITIEQIMTNVNIDAISEPQLTHCNPHTQKVLFCNRK